MKAKDIWDNKKEILAGIKNTLHKQVFIEHIASERQAICDKCPHISTECAALIKTCCSVCGCSLNFKTRSLQSSCPEGNWPALEDKK